MRSALIPALFLALLAACGTNTPSGRFTVVMRTHPDLERSRTALEQSFTKTTGDTLELILLPDDNYERRMMKLLADRVAAPPALTETGRPALLAHLQASLPFAAVLDAWPRLQTDELFGDFIRMRTAPGGALYALNLHYPEPLVLLSAAAEVPGTATGLLKAARAAARPARSGAADYGYGWDAPLPHLLLHAADGALIAYDEATGTWVPAFTSTMALRELTALAALYHEGAIPPALFTDTGSRTGTALFRAGHLCCLVTDTRTALALHRDRGVPDFTVAPLPRGTVKPAGGIAAAWARTSASVAPERTVAFLEWWYGPASALLARPAPDARIPSWLRYDRHTASADTGIIATLHRITTHGRIRFTDHPRMPEIREIVDRYWAYAVTDSMRPDDAVAAAVDEIKKRQLLR